MKTSSVFGEFFKTKRQALGMTLREFCLKHALDPGNLSRLERGLLPPPQDHGRLAQYAKYLELKSGSDDWYTFFDLAAAAKGRLPEELLQDEALVAKLPLVFRTLRGNRITDQQLNTLAQRVHGTVAQSHTVQQRPRLIIPHARLAAFCRKHHIRRLALFGSVLRDDFRPESDVDVLVEFQPGHTPGLAFFAMQEELSRLLGRRVDLQTPRFLSRYFRDAVVAEAQVQYDHAR